MTSPPSVGVLACPFLALRHIPPLIAWLCGVTAPGGGGQASLPQRAPCLQCRLLTGSSDPKMLELGLGLGLGPETEPHQPLFTGEGIEAQRGRMSCVDSHSQLGKETE